MKLAAKITFLAVRMKLWKNECVGTNGESKSWKVKRKDVGLKTQYKKSEKP